MLRKHLSLSHHFHYSLPGLSHHHMSPEHYQGLPLGIPHSTFVPQSPFSTEQPEKTHQRCGRKPHSPTENLQGPPPHPLGPTRPRLPPLWSCQPDWPLRGETLPASGPLHLLFSCVAIISPQRIEAGLPPALPFGVLSNVTST